MVVEAVSAQCVNELVYLLQSFQMQGTVKFFNETKGFGFITPSNSGADIFVHASGLVDQIRENDKVEYDEQDGKKGKNAVNVTLVN
jgi:cold shock protein